MILSPRAYLNVSKTLFTQKRIFFVVIKYLEGLKIISQNVCYKKMFKDQQIDLKF